MNKVQQIVPCLWFDNQAEEAAIFYTSVFKNSKISKISRYGKEGYEYHGKTPGTVMVVSFEIEGQQYSALNAGPEFKFNESISLQVMCKDQAEVDYYWEKLTSGGGQEGSCGWLKDKYGLSWQVVPVILEDMMTDPDVGKIDRVMNTFFRMKKFNIEELKKAFDGR